MSDSTTCDGCPSPAAIVELALESLAAAIYELPDERPTLTERPYRRYHHFDLRDMDLEELERELRLAQLRLDLEQAGGQDVRARSNPWLPERIAKLTQEIRRRRRPSRPVPQPTRPPMDHPPRRRTALDEALSR